MFMKEKETMNVRYVEKHSVQKEISIPILKEYTKKLEQKNTNAVFAEKALEQRALLQDMLKNSMIHSRRYLLRKKWLNKNGL